MNVDLIERLRKRAAIRRQIPDRRSVQEGQPDRLADLLDEAAAALEATHEATEVLRWMIPERGMLRQPTDEIYERACRAAQVKAAVDGTYDPDYMEPAVRAAIQRTRQFAAARVIHGSTPTGDTAGVRGGSTASDGGSN